MERYLKLFTFIPMQNIASLMSEHNVDPGKRKAQHLLASEVLELVHGREEAIKARAEHQAMRNPNIASLVSRESVSATEQHHLGETATADEQRVLLPKSRVLNTPIYRILYYAGLVPTKSEGARLVAKGGVYVAAAAAARGESGSRGELSFVQVKDQKMEDIESFLLGDLLIVRVGKWKTRIIQVVEDETFVKEPAIGEAEGKAVEGL